MIRPCPTCDGSGIDPASYIDATPWMPSQAEPCPTCRGGSMSDLRVWVLPDDIGHADDLESMLRSYGGREIVLRQKLFQDVDTVGEVFTFAYEVVEEA